MAFISTVVIILLALQEPATQPSTQPTTEPATRPTTQPIDPEEMQRRRDAAAARAERGKSEQRERRRAIEEQKRRDGEAADAWWAAHGGELKAIDDDIESVREQMRRIDDDRKDLSRDRARDMEETERAYKKAVQIAAKANDPKVQQEARRQRTEEQRRINQRCDDQLTEMKRLQSNLNRRLTKLHEDRSEFLRKAPKR